MVLVQVGGKPFGFCDNAIELGRIEREELAGLAHLRVLLLPEGGLDLGLGAGTEQYTVAEMVKL
eukprot:1736544-Rhodomonas_salina.1